MNKKQCTQFLLAVLAIAMTSVPARACTWAAYAAGKVALVARTVDWYSDDNAVLKGHGRNVRVKAANTPDALEYTTKYASIQVHSWGDLAVDAVNEKGLQGSILFLDNSRLPDRQPGRKDIDPMNFIAYAVSSFATVQEVVDGLKGLNFIPAPMGLPDADGQPLRYDPVNWPGHYAFADASGNRAIIEFIKGEVTVYQGREHDAMTNEPWYEHHLMFESLGYKPNGSITTIDRLARAKQYLRDMRERGVTTRGRAILALRGLLASVSAGSEEIDRTSNNEVYPTIWGAVIDLNKGVYYLSRTKSWCSEIYDFSMFSPDKPEVVTLEAKDCPYAEEAIVSETEMTAAR